MVKIFESNFSCLEGILWALPATLLVMCAASSLRCIDTNALRVKSSAFYIFSGLNDEKATLKRKESPTQLRSGPIALV